MSMVHPALLTAKRPTEDGRRGDDELRCYVATECRGNLRHWFDSLISGAVKTKPAKTLPSSNLTDQCTDVKATSECCCPVMKALSENTLTRGEITGKR